MGPVTVAVVLPFIDEHVASRMTPVLHRWNSPSYAPCASGQPLSATAMFYHPLNRSTNEAVITRIWSDLTPDARSCFSGGMRFLYGNIEHKVAMAHPDGTCAQFYALFVALRGVAETFFIMEPDVTPIRPGWLTELVRLAEPNPTTVASRRGSHFWILGSVSRCDGSYGDIRVRQDLHINGNALYRVGDPAFDEYLRRVRAFFPAHNALRVAFPGCATGEAGEDGFDHSIFQYLHHERNFDYARTVLHRFQYTEYVQNLCEDAFDEADVRRRYPDTYLVHSKWPYFTEQERQARKWYWDRTLQYPEKKTHKELIRNLSSPERRGVLERRLCSSQRYKMLAARNKPLEPCVRLCEENESYRANMPATCRLAYERMRWAKMMPAHQPYVWTTDMHVGPPSCYAGLVEEIGARMHAEVDFFNCEFNPSFCKKRLKVLSFDDWKGFSLDPCPNRMRERFFDAYKNDPEFQRVDLFVCSHPAANCELYMPFNRSILVYATTRIEFGRNDPFVEWRKPYMSKRNLRRWEEWATNLKRIAAKPGNVVAANSMYDVRYVEYLTGVKPLYLPSWCEPSEVGTGGRVRYARGWRQPVLLGMYRDNLDFPNFSDARSWQHPILRGLTRASSRSRFSFKRMHELYEKYEWWQIMRHPALILIPYQVSTISFFEIYRTGMPIFAPSLRLLCEWVREHGIMWERIYGTPTPMRGAASSPHAPSDPMALRELNDPNNNCTETECSLEYWLGLSDWYVFKHVQYFDSWEDLVSQLETADLDGISRAMAAFNREQRSQIKEQWRGILKNAVRQREGRTNRLWSGAPSLDFSAAMRSLYDAPPMPSDAEARSKCTSSDPSSRKLYKCVSSDDALYYGCVSSFDANNAWYPDGDTVVSCNYKEHTAVGEMCPRSLPYCEGYRKWTPTQSRRMGKCFRMPHWRRIWNLILPSIVPTLLVALALSYMHMCRKSGWLRQLASCPKPPKLPGFAPRRNVVHKARAH
jgi:hypothetical protein